MANNYVMPKLAMAMNEGTINEWLVKEGEYVEQGAPIMVVETEKVSYDLESPSSGYLHILVAEGETVLCEVPIAQFMESADDCTAASPEVEAPALATASPETQYMLKQIESTPPQAVNQRGRIIASPLAKKIARDANLDLSRVSGTGPAGRIVKRDVLLALENPVAHITTPVATGPLVEKLRISVKGTARATIAKHMLTSLQTTAQLSSAWVKTKER